MSLSLAACSHSLIAVLRGTSHAGQASVTADGCDEEDMGVREGIWSSPLSPILSRAVNGALQALIRKKLAGT